MTEINWARVDAFLHQPVYKLDDSSPPVTAVGGTSPEALRINGLRESQAISDAFASVGWSVGVGHDYALTAGYTCDGVPTSFGFCFDQTPRGVRSWVVATAAVTPNSDDVLSDKERQLIAAVMEFAESPFETTAGVIRMGRGLTFPDVEEAYWPTPFAQVAKDWNVLVGGPGGMRVEAMDQPVRVILVGYHWMWVPDATMRNTAITHAVDALPKVLAAIGDLQVQDPNRFSQYLGASIPIVQMHSRVGELRGTPMVAANRFCGNCGKQRLPEHRFCAHCGTAFA